MSFGLDAKTHGAYLAARGIPPDYRRHAGIEFLGAGDTKRVVFVASPSIKVTYHGLDGRPIDHARYRLLDPAATPDGRKFTQAKGSALRLYFPRFPARSKRSWAKLAKNTRERIVVTEGEFKAARAALAGLNCLGLGGVDAWRAGEPLPDWLLINWKKRRVELCFDTDVHTNPRVRRALIGLADYLASLGALVTVRVLFDVTGTGKTGLDDFLTAGRRYEDAPAYDLDSEFIKSWRLPPDAAMPALRLESVPREWLDVELPPQEYVLDPLIPRGIVSLLVAEGGSGKSQLGLGLAVAVATGTAFLDLAVAKGRVAYVALEDPIDVVRRRVRQRYLDLPVAKASRYAQDLARNLATESVVGAQLHLISAEYKEVTQNAAVLDFIRERLRDRGPFDLVILDPLARLHGGEENSNAVGTALINAIENLKAGLDGGAILVTHHTGKQATQSKDASAQAARGASALTDAARSVLRLVPATDDEYKDLDDTDKAYRRVRKLVHAKSNYARRHPDLWLRQTEGGYFHRFEPPAGMGNPDARYAAMLQQLRAWRAGTGKAFSKRQLRQDARPLIFADTSRGDVDRFLLQALERGDVVSAGTSRGGAALDLAASEKESADA